MGASRCSDDDMFLRLLRRNVNAITEQCCLQDAAAAFLLLPPVYVTGCIESFAAAVSLPPDLAHSPAEYELTGGFKAIYRSLAACVLAPELVNAYV